MLVLSRRPEETIVFPEINTTITFLKVKGNVARIGIDAPRRLQVLRGELTPAEDNGEPVADVFTQNHALRNRLNTAALGLTVLRRQLAEGLYADAARTLDRIVLDVDSEQPAEEAPAAPQRPARPLTLLVEDDANERHLLAGLLRTCGFDVETATNGREAINFLEAGNAPQLVLMDMLMPGCDGPTAVRAIRASSRFQGMRIFAVSGTSPKLFGIETGPLGVDRWFRKPLNPEKLLDELTREFVAA